MSFWTDLRLPSEQELLIGFYDLKGYLRQGEARTPLALLELMSGYFALTGRMIDEQGGRLIKTMGDAGLVAFPAALADAGVRTLQRIQAEGRDWLAARDWRSRAIVKLHLGPVALGVLAAFEASRWVAAAAVYTLLSHLRLPRPVAFAAGVYGGTFVPTMIPWTVACGPAPWIWPSMTFDGLRSRWMTPREWA